MNLLPIILVTTNIIYRLPFAYPDGSLLAGVQLSSGGILYETNSWSGQEILWDFEHTNNNSNFDFSYERIHRWDITNWPTWPSPGVGATHSWVTNQYGRTNFYYSFDGVDDRLMFNWRPHVFNPETNTVWSSSAWCNLASQGIDKLWIIHSNMLSTNRPGYSSGWKGYVCGVLHVDDSSYATNTGWFLYFTLRNRFSGGAADRRDGIDMWMFMPHFGTQEWHHLSWHWPGSNNDGDGAWFTCDGVVLTNRYFYGRDLTNGSTRTKYDMAQVHKGPNVGANGWYTLSGTPAASWFWKGDLDRIAITTNYNMTLTNILWQYQWTHPLNNLEVVP